MIKQKQVKNSYFLVIPEKLGTNTGLNSLNSMLGMLHDVRDKEYKNHDVGAIMGYLKVPRKGPFSNKANHHKSRAL